MRYQKHLPIRSQQYRSEKKQKFDSSPAVPSSPTTYDFEPNVAEKSFDRDHVCILTKSTDPINSSHISPFSLAKSRADT